MLPVTYTHTPAHPLQQAYTTASLPRLQEKFKSCLQKFTEKAQDEDGLIMLKFAKSESSFCMPA
jgi:hypothetical protein